MDGESLARHERLESRVAQLEKRVVGNGNQLGLNTRVDRLEQSRLARKEQFALWFTLLAAIVAAAAAVMKW